MAASASSRLLFGDRVPGITDVHGRPAVRSGTGGWRSSLFIIGVEVAERLAYYGASSNLITYLTDYLNQNTATAAKNVNIWSGVASLLPLLGAFVADSYLGRYRTIIISSLIYLLGLILLTLSAAVPSLQPNGCYKTEPRALAKCHGSSTFQVAFFFFSLYLIALGQGGHKPCVQSFGADQFNEDDPTERRGKASFFNWWYMGICGGSLLAVSVVMYVQDNMGWGLGFGIPAVAMAMGLGAFLWGRTSYRLSVPGGSPFIKIVQVIVAAARKRNVPWPQSVKWEEDEEDEEKLLLWSSEVYELRTNRTLPHTKQFSCSFCARLLSLLLARIACSRDSLH
ncbi:hypothetical protein AMTR_s00118p00129200 [Amborella trichopoda]|uniref:Major facilitator superfamily (MFS) profile domain-containing protein n=1 Tax=Amborella trichopoda TaxID=13333 RepID=W1NSQ4_AMBTC|nr:hypothetical protein AMTR_s00118p00129200 [Amborella trichopoda]